MTTNSVPSYGFISIVWSCVLLPKENGIVLLAGCYLNLIDPENNNYSIGTTGGHILINAQQTLTILSMVVSLSSSLSLIKLIGSVP